MIAIRHERRIRMPCSDRHAMPAPAQPVDRVRPIARQRCNLARRPVSHSVGQPLQFETCRSCHRSLSQNRFPKNKATGKGKPEKVSPFWKSIDIQSLVSTCRMHEVNPYTWLVDVLQRIDPSRPRCDATDATTVEGALCRQPVDVRHRKGRPGTRAQIRDLNFTNQRPPWVASQNDRLPWRRNRSRQKGSIPCDGKRDRASRVSTWTGMDDDRKGRQGNRQDAIGVLHPPGLGTLPPEALSLTPKSRNNKRPQRGHHVAALRGG